MLAGVTGLKRYVDLGASPCVDKVIVGLVMVGHHATIVT
jgi:hypothetical protein